MPLSQAYADINKQFESFPACKTCRWYEQLTPEDKRFFDGVADDPNINYLRLLKACKVDGLDVVPSSFRNHINEHHARVRGY